MCVGIGSFSDPLEAQGLAHFLEHMLFMGSAKFPDENEYASYLSKHGGSSNAHTEAEHTCYYFDVKREFLKGALKRWSGRLDNFIDGLEELLEGLDDDSFENYKGGLMAKVLEKDAYLTCETNRLWSLWTQILDKWYTFDYSKKAAEQLRSIQKEDVINFYKTYLQQSSPKRRRLATRVWGCNQRFKRRMHEARRFARALSLKSLKALLMCKSLKTLQEAEEARPESVQVIEDLAAFKMSSKFYDCKRCQKVTPLKS